MPCGKKIPTNRLLAGTAAVCASNVRAGTIASSNGSANAAPAPLRMVRRGMCRLVMNISVLLVFTPGALPGVDICLSRCSLLGCRRSLLRRRCFIQLHVLLERIALHDGQHQRGEPVARTVGLTGDGAHEGHILVFHAPAER